MNKIAELFGLFCGETVRTPDPLSSTPALREAIAAQRCPYSGRQCYKTRKSHPGTAIGTCTVRYQAQPLIICPARLLDNQQVFLDCLHLLRLHEPGNELFVIPEVSIPGGSIDFFLVSAKEAVVKDFVGIELQTLDTTGTVWPERQRLLLRYGLPADQSEAADPRTFGINWKMTAKTILMQLHHKSETFETLHKHLVLVIQKPFLDYIRRAFSFSHIQGVRPEDSIHIHAYQLQESGEKLKLSLYERVSTNSDGIAKSMGLNATSRMELDALTAILQQKLREQYRLSIPTVS